EAGFHERFNRALVNFDPNAELPITAAAQAAYAAVAFPELPADRFAVRGGSVYLGQSGLGQNGRDSSHLSENMLMPRLGIVYMLDNQTVVRGGYGLFYDTNNVLNNDLNQFGYNRDTATPVSNNNGLTFTSANLTSAECLADTANCTTIFSDPFPVRADGTRFNAPVGNALGLMAGVGTNIGYIPLEWKHARQQRWRFSIQRELSKNMVFEFAYVGASADNLSVAKRIDALPEQYWATGVIRNNGLADNLNTQVRNPFNIGNFASLQTSNPQLYQYMANNPFFTATTRSKGALLRPSGHLNGSTISRAPLGENRFNSLEFTLTKRFAQGLQYMASYVRVWNQERISFDNEFDARPVWRESNNSRPHTVRFNATWELPVGKGHRFLAGSKVAKIFLSGWRTSAIYNFRSGAALDTGNWFFYGDDLRALVKSGDERTNAEWFNWQLLPGASRDYTSADRSRYEARVRQLVPQSVLAQMGNICGPQNNTACTYENVIPTNFQPNGFHRRVFPQRLSFVRTPIANQIDLNLSRTIAVTEKLKMHFRTDFINALNHVNYVGPNNDITSSNFGRVSNQANTPRWIQFQLRFTF
ncbi:MAG TPA: hypothetical protein VJ302_28215, partial [Blastocatellia bacterium]|nr:hypothetical protein [Blastocatellia bacterium]